jgi:alkanesulfonate monooxygenase SsuD/methylene tetrahydromethanopterin reductase-like flavin-dependent oxidoreductase (luciferase family)
MHDTIALAEAAEDAGMDGAWIRIHHFDQNMSSPFPILAAMGARTSRVELGTGVINMRYENPLYMAEAAATTDLIARGRLQLGVSRGSPEPAADGPATFGYPLPAGMLPVEDAAERIARFREAVSGVGMAEPGSQAHGVPGQKLPITPQSPGLSDRIWYGAGNTDSARRVGELGMHLMSSTLVLEATGEPLGVVQNRQIEAFRESWRGAGHAGEPRVSVSRSIMPIVDDATRMYFGPLLERDALGGNKDQVGSIDNSTGTFGKSYVGDIDKIVTELREDDAVMSADTVLVTIPNQLGAEFNRTTFDALVEIRNQLS